MAKFNEYPAKATPEDNDTLMIYDAAAKANKLSPFSGIWNWIVGKLTNAVIANLQTNNKTVLGAINELNSNLLRVNNVNNSVKEILLNRISTQKDILHCSMLYFTNDSMSLINMDIYDQKITKTKAYSIVGEAPTVSVDEGVLKISIKPWRTVSLLLPSYEFSVSLSE